MSYRRFTYNRHSALLNLLSIVVLIVISLLLVSTFSIDSMYLLLLISFEAVFMLLSISPLFTYHEMTEGVLVLRQGWYFRAKVPLRNIKTVSRLDHGPIRTGVFFALRSSTLFVTTRRADLIEIELREKQKFLWALGKKADKIVFDVTEPEKIVNALTVESSLPPIKA